MRTILSAALALGFCGLAGARDDKADPVGTWKCEYTIGEIAPGNYFLAIEAPGFKKYERDGLALQVAGTAVIDVSLELGRLPNPCM